MSYAKYNYNNLKNLCMVVFQKLGLSLENSEVTTDVLLKSDLYGIESHGIQRLILYYKGLSKGAIKADANIKVLKETPVSAVIDGDSGVGQIIGKKAMNIAIEKAKTVGIGISVVKNSNHYGIAGYYAEMAAKENLLGISMTNSPAITVPTFGKLAMMGSNPIAIAMPAKPYPFLLDMSTSVVTRGKLEVYNKKNEDIPLGWAIDNVGKNTSNPKDVLFNLLDNLGGGLLPLGGSSELTSGHKGYGLALSVELFTAILSGGLTANHIDKNISGKTSHFFLAIDYGILGDKEEIENNMSNYLKELRESPKADGASRIYTHGEKEIEASKERLENGILMNDGTIKEINDICLNLDINISDYLKASSNK